MSRSEERIKRQLETSREWKKNNPSRHAELARAYRARNREKTRAQNVLNYAIRKGRLTRKPCEVCGTNERVHAHHHDYRLPLDVHWLCFQCHKKAHPVSDDDKEIKFSGARKARLYGALNPNAVLDDKSVQQIKAMLETGISQERIAKAFGVDQTTVSRIKLGKVYNPPT